MGDKKKLIRLNKDLGEYKKELKKRIKDNKYRVYKI